MPLFGTMKESLQLRRAESMWVGLATKILMSISRAERPGTRNARVCCTNLDRQ
jgi:hypothetical protein